MIEPATIAASSCAVVAIVVAAFQSERALHWKRAAQDTTAQYVALCISERNLKDSLSRSHSLLDDVEREAFLTAERLAAAQALVGRQGKTIAEQATQIAKDAARRSASVSKGNRTRYAKQRALIAAKTAELAECVKQRASA